MTVPCAALIVLDGWGLAEPGPGNAVSLAATPVFDDLWARYPHTQLTACGRAVGLPEGQMGNSEVGHLNLGAGFRVLQDLPRINAAIGDGSFHDNEVLLSTWWWQSEFELVRPQGHESMSEAQRARNTILGVLESVPATKRVLVGQL